jgi:heme oxygenase
MMLYKIYTALELSLAAHASHPHLSTTYDPALLSRADSIERDIAYYTGDPQWVSSGSSTIWEEVQREEGALGEYVSRLRGLSESEDKAILLLAHAYVRYRTL